MKILIVEDETIAAHQLERFVKSYNDTIEVVQILNSCNGLKRWLEQKEEADLIFCDIELNDGNVLNTLKNIDLNYAIIFTTAYDNFWDKALKLNGIDYLLKPLTKEKIHAALDKAESIKKVFTRDKTIISTLASMLSQPSKFYKKRFPVKLNNEVFVLSAESIMLFRIVEGVIFAITEKDKKYPLVEETLNDLELKLNPENFFRVNRSEIINAEYISSIRIQDGKDYMIHIKGSEQKLSVSNSRVAALKDWLDDPSINLRYKA
ncbi:MAG TPA: LytTR family DNA-binding domain-containing protein [Segetibacter sp.]|jgi:DNA-binding LytR/AlgR family response regulator